MNPITPDGRYFVVNATLWRCSNPSLDDDERQRLVNELMDARRAVKAAKASGDPGEMKIARAAVQATKVALGERGPVWWDDGAPDLNRHGVKNTPYSDWYQTLAPTDR
ncbi:hypothetical protein [Pseudomonas sp. LS-2]|jgi:hypothetical protein|uniref:hypothetical protein n=1 Tax=Pseudomonas sp. LS-2 TaxID=2315859 RepID=UPI000E746C90|nr:hypothetical protein [Pseudomonas sp. LS-2]RJX74962.1 hypothetical protein D3M70_26685 [Pseudomonas sp. LS-2]